jgi:hypothetical protein
LDQKITHHTNNQNGITARDLQSNNVLQTRLQAEFNDQFKGKIFYAIKRGDNPEHPAEIIDNELAGRILLAFDLQEPWSCHQTYRLFDDLHAPLFGRPEVTAQRIFAMWNIYEFVLDHLPKLKNQLMARYSLTRYFLIYLLRNVLESDEQGKKFIENPAVFVDSTKKLKRLETCLGSILEDLIIELNAEAEEREEDNNPIDYKRELKSPNGIRSLSRNIMPQYRKALARGRVNSFSDEWKDAK